VAAAPESPAVPFFGLTGAIASGKSEALDALARLGAATLSSDAVVHELLGSNEVRDLLVERWGSDVAPGGVVDRGRVGEIVFGSPDELAWLESVLHPRVRERIVVWRAGLDARTPLAVVEVPLLFETGMEAAFDETIAVIAADGLRVRRAGARGTSDLEARAGRQLSQEEKAERATHVIANDGSISDLERALSALMPAAGPGGERG
jgi:dephospho-CoA kinase